MYHPPYAVWSIWRDCGWLERFVLILLGCLILYSSFAAALTVLRIRSMKTSRLAVGPDIEAALKTLQRRWNHVQRATEATFYLFGFVLFLVLQSVGVTVGDGGPGWAANQILNNFILSCAFAANAFLGFLILHLIRWLVSSRIAACFRALGGVS